LIILCFQDLPLSQSDPKYYGLCFIQLKIILF